jgi:tetratricopeptide (TPR) repeat protein
MRLFWTSRDQVQNCTPGSDVPRLAVSSTPKEWAHQGYTLFKHKNYFQAMHCFKRAALQKEVDISNAYYLRAQARKAPMQNRLVRSTTYIEAARAFLHSGADANGTKDSRTYYRIAAECFEKAESEREAADTYLLAGEYDTPAKLYRKLGLFDQAVVVIQNHRSSMDAQTADGIVDVAKFFYLNQCDFKYS